MADQQAEHGSQRVDAIIAAYIEAVEAGQVPDRQELVARHPDLAVELAAFFADHDKVQQMAEPLRADAEEPQTLPPSETVGAPGIVLRCFGDYELLDEIARGGMGVVYKARQVSLNRVVALKMILAGQLASEADVQRFRTEAENAANLDHPNIVPIYEVGEHDGQHYFSMKLIEGSSLAQAVSSRQWTVGSKEAGCRAAGLIAVVAQAVHYAHQRGILHRDLKPGNILLDAQDQPHITDFGLAKRIEGGVGLTQTGAIVGTPSYMPPEQARAEKGLTTAIDVYSLGAILYELLTRHPPFQAVTPLDTVLQVLEQEPVPPRRVQPEIPTDLETICLKCLQKEPGKRYASAGELADDIRRFLAGEPIRARPVGRVKRAAKWVRRNLLVAALLAAVVLSVLGGATGIVVKYLDAKEQERIARQQEGIARGKAKEAEDEAVAARKAEALAEDRKTLAEERERDAKHQLAVSNVLLARVAWDSNNAAAARERLEAVPADLRRWEWHYLNREYHGGILALYGHTSFVRLAFSPDGTRLATASGDWTARVWDARTGQPLLECRGHTGPVTCVAFSPDGTRLATASADRTARLWNSRTGRPLAQCKGHTDPVTSVAFNPEGTRLATASYDKAARVWDAGTGGFLQECKGHTGEVFCVAFSPDGTRLATASVDGTARLWNAATGQPLAEYKDPRGSAILSVAFSPDGVRIATASSNHLARVWDVRTGRPLVECKGHSDQVSSVTFSPDGTRLATASSDRTARVWDALAGRVLLECKGHTDGLYGVAFSPEGTRLATASVDKTARLWDARTGRPVLECKGHASRVLSVAFSPDGARLATASHDGTARIWDARTARPLVECEGHRGQVMCLAFNPDGTLLATAGVDGTARLWDALTGHFLREYKGGVCHSVAFSPDGTYLATDGVSGTGRLLDARTGRPCLEYKGHTGELLSVAFSPDGTRLATGSWDKTARLWDARTGACMGECKGHSQEVLCVAFSGDGMQLATASGDKTARLWDARTGRFLREFKAHTGRVTSVAFGRDGTRLATGSEDKTTRVWDVGTGQSLLECKGHTDGVTSVAFSPDGTWLATASNDKTVRMWDARPLPLPAEDELKYRLWATRPEPDWHHEQFLEFKNTDRFAAAVHLDRLLAHPPAEWGARRRRQLTRTELLRYRTAYLEATLKQDGQDASARLPLARTAWHSPALGPKETAALLPPASDKGLLQRRTRAGLLLRQQKPNEAVAVLEAALKERCDDKPPAEELLLAWAYLDTKQPDKAKEMWNKATAWLDRGQQAVRAADAVGALPVGVLQGMGALFAPPADPRYNPFDWETWHEIDVLCRELAPRFEARKP
jgi:WD40 repeat protein/tRNA A-37 threonylcarbamoyl transferase component Bud32